jgi:hypothetical protein
MIDPVVLRSMLDAGCTAEQIVAVAENAVRAAEERAAEKREKDRLRKRAEREEKKNRKNNDGVLDVRRTTGTNEDNSDNPSSFEVSPRTPLPKTSNPIPPSPPKGGSSPQLAKPNGFARFWEAYRRKVGKRSAEAAFERACKRIGEPDPLAVILAGLDRCNRSRSWREEPEFIPHPATWLNRDGWEDELEPGAQVTPPEERPPGFWRQALRIHQESGRWQDNLGPAPGQPGCLIPAEILAEFDIGSVVPFEPRRASA